MTPPHESFLRTPLHICDVFLRRVIVRLLLWLADYPLLVLYVEGRCFSVSFQLFVTRPCLVVSSYPSVLVELESILGQVFPRPCKFVLLPFYQVQELRGPFLQDSSLEGTRESDDQKPCKNAVVALQVRFYHKARFKIRSQTKSRFFLISFC